MSFAANLVMERETKPSPNSTHAPAIQLRGANHNPNHFLALASELI